MAAKPAAKPKETVDLATEGVTVTVIDALNHDGQACGPGDRLELGAEEAATLRALGVVSFDDAVAADERADLMHVQV